MQCGFSSDDTADEECTGGPDWYARQISHWDKRAEEKGLTYEAVIGESLSSDTDIRDSKQFLLKLIPHENFANGLVALDCAAGLGRVTTELLLHFFMEVDLLEPSQPLMDEARRLLTQPRTRDSQENEHPADHRAVHFFQLSFHEHRWSDLPHRYDVIWLQWAMDKLSDEHAVSMLVDARNWGLRRSDSLVILKENICAASLCSEAGDFPDGYIIDDEPTITRSLAYLEEKIIKPGGFEIVDQAIQTDLDPALYPIYMLALRPTPK